MPETEQPEEVVRETARGRSARTPGLALGGVVVTIAVAVAVVGGIIALIYLLA